MTRTIQRLAQMLALATLLVVTGRSASAITVAVTPSSASIAVGDTVVVDLTVSGLGDFAGPSLGGWQVILSYDPALLAAGALTFGPGLNLNGAGTINGSGGVAPITIFEASFASASDLLTLQPGNFVLASLSFEALAVGNSVLGLVVTGALDHGGAVLPVDAEASSIEVTAVEIPAPGGVLLFVAAMALLARNRRLLSPASIR